MQNITTAEELRAAIVALEIERNEEGRLLRSDLMRAYESIKPINLIKSVFREVAQSPDIKNNLVNSGLSMVAGTVVKSLIVGDSHNPVRKLVGTAIMFGVTNIISKHPKIVNSISLIGQTVINLVKVRMKTNSPEDS
jgi:hypothetical protein